jgi:hypothetical protein
MGSRLIDPLAAAREDEVNRGMRLSGSPVRFCFHPDTTLEHLPGEGTRRSCDYCATAVFTYPGSCATDLTPWAYLPDGYTAADEPPVTGR